MTSFVYATAPTLDGFLADDDSSLDWLFKVEGGENSLAALETSVGAMVEGSTTYRWVWGLEGLLDSPHKLSTCGAEAVAPTRCTGVGSCHVSEKCWRIPPRSARRRLDDP